MNKRACVLAVAVAAGLTGTTQVALAQLPQLPVPTPSLPVPTPTLPDVPDVPVPDVPVPDVPVPVPPPPSLPDPVPHVPVPSVPVPSGGGGGGGGGGGSAVPVPTGGGGSGSSTAGGGSGTRSSGGSGSSGSGTRASTGGSGGSTTATSAHDDTSSSGGGSTGGPSGGARSDRGGRAGHANDEAREARLVAKQRRLERTVARLRPCLPELPQIVTRVLVLRAGVGSADALTRRQVAHRIDRPVRVVRRYERRGIRRLRQAARAGECTPAAVLPAPDGAGVSGGTATTDAEVAEGTTIAAGTDGEGGTDAARAGDDGGADGGGSGGVKGESRERGPIAGILPPAPGPKDITLPVLLLVLAMAAVGGVWMIRRARDAAERWPDAGA